MIGIRAPGEASGERLAPRPNARTDWYTRRGLAGSSATRSRRTSTTASTRFTIQ